MKPPSTHLPAVDAIKALASQLIVWHHLAFYGPMSDAALPLAPDLIGWLYDQARIAVQAFLVVGGFLAARSLMPGGNALRADVLPLLRHRYLRLARPYWVALVVAIGCAWAARGLVDDPTIPAAPSPTQILAHLLMLQDIVGVEALSAGVWYVAMDFQLYGLLVLLVWAARQLAAPAGAVLTAFLLCTGLTAASLFWLNRDPRLDVWAPYFFGAYGLGIMAQWLSSRPRKAWWSTALALTVLAALVLEWRSRIFVAGLTALLLAWTTDGRFAPRWVGGAAVAFLSRISYSVFLIHYPICIIVGAVVFRLRPDSPGINALGMVAAWLLSLAAGALLHRFAESRGRRVRTDAPYPAGAAPTSPDRPPRR